MSATAAEDQVRENLRQNLVALRSGRDPELAMAAAQAEQNLHLLFKGGAHPPLASSRRRVPRPAKPA